MSSDWFEQRVSTRTGHAAAAKAAGTMQLNWIQEGVAYVALVGSGVGLRLACHDLPNFAPVAAIALFAGYFFRSALLALSVPLLVMAISDVFVGGYDWMMMGLVYSMLAMPVLFRGWLRQAFSLHDARLSKTLASLAGLFASGLLSSLLFFFVTNFGVWVRYGTYERSWAGLYHCYMMALPFFRYTLAGDLFFTVVLFGSFALALSVSRSRVPVAQLS